jgi:DNA-binding CsgD family transcriptional regulator
VGSPAKSWREQVFGPERARTLKSRLFVLLRDELGLGREPKVASLLVEEILTVVETTMVDVAHVGPGQLVVLAPELGQGASWAHRRLEDKRMKAVVLDLIDPQDIEALASGQGLASVRHGRLARLVHQAYEQGATLTSCQLAMMTGISPSRVSEHLRSYMREHGEVLPTRGIIEDCSPAVSHKAEIIARHLKGETTSEIARATDHTPRSVERYIARFEQVRELVGYLAESPDPPAIAARILNCSERLVRTYLGLMEAAEQAESRAEAATP